MSNGNGPARGLTSVQWLICIIASIGFAFDIYELLMLPLILRPALLELANVGPNDPQFALWRGLMFFVPALIGGVFGLYGGYLTDRLGRRTVLTWSILLYAFSAFAAGFSTSLGMLLFFRCTTFIGVCVEFVAAVAWLAELFPEHARRERVLGYTQAFSSIGGLLVALVNGYLVVNAANLPAISVPGFLEGIWGSIAPNHQHEAWRYTLMSGVIPALPLIVIRPFLPESPAWQKKREAGTLGRPSIRELFAPALRKTTIVTTIMFACSYGAAFGAIQQMPQIAPALSEVRAATADKPVPEQKRIEQSAAAHYTKIQEVGGLVGRFLLALLAVRIVSRRALVRIFQGPGLVLLPFVFGYVALNNQQLFSLDLSGIGLGELHVSTFFVGMFLVGLTTVAQFSFWGNYLPRVYPLHLRGTGESFAANIGGRMIGTSFAFVTSWLATQPFVPGESDPVRMAYCAAGVGAFVYVVGFLASFWLPEPTDSDLAD